MDRKEIEEEIRKEMEGVHIDFQDLRKIDTKIEASKDVIKDLDYYISRGHGLSKVLLQWHKVQVQDTLTRCEILRDIAREIYLEKN